MMQKGIRIKKRRGQQGIALIEVLVSLALLGVIAASFLSGTQMTSKARVQADDRASAKIIAESVLDNIKMQGFAPEYTVTLPDEYSGYNVDIGIEYLRNDYLQRITVNVSRNDKAIFELEGYKVKR